VRPPLAAESKARQDGQNKYFNLNIFAFLLSKNLKPLSQIKGDSTKECDF
jgi:hypothetical protein